MFQLLLLLGFYTLGISTIRQYHFINKNKTWAEAQQYCRENYTDLATVHNFKEQLAFTYKIGDNQRTWIGLYDDLNSWKWSLNDEDLNKEGEKSFSNWHIQKPTHRDRNTLCVAYTFYHTSWWTMNCSDLMPFVCYDGKANVSEKYILIYDSKNWTEAQRYCRKHHTDLASIRNETENQNLISIKKPYLSSFVWIGLYRTQSWSDKSNSSFTYWELGQPDNAGGSENCTAVDLSVNGAWRDENCNQEISFFCYRTVSSTSYQYHFINTNMTWTEAQMYCRENYTDLATINNMEDMNMLLIIANGSYSGLAWIGLYDDLESWRWSLNDDDFYKNGEREFRGWYHQPDNFAGNEMCGLMVFDGTWYDEDCNNTVSQFVCYDGTSATEDYIWIDQYMTWPKAQNYCRQHYTDLASVKSQEDNDRILNLIRGYGSWIGFHRRRLWSDQDNSQYEHWKPQTISIPEQPDNGASYSLDYKNQHCTAVVIRNSGRWADENCLVRLPFFCYNKLGTGSSCNSHQFYFVNKNKTWSEAQKHCRDFYTDLATINNMEEMKRLLTSVNEEYYGFAWIGLYDDLNSWKWSLNDEVFDKEGEKSFRNWYMEKPTNYGRNSQCAYFSTYGGVWNEGSCSDEKHFFCFDGKENVSESFILVDQKLNWTEAQRYCRDHYTDLASVRNEKENEKLKAKLFQSEYNYYMDYYGDYYYGNKDNYYMYYDDFFTTWIGLYRTWSWSDKTNYSFSNWMLGEPGGWSQNCTAVSFIDSGQWSTEDCGQALPFLCYSTISSPSYRQYYFVNESKNWTEAQRYCRENYTDLATIENMEEMNRTFNTVNDSYSGLAWIGLYDDLDSWRWSLSDDVFYKEGEKEFREWEHQPDNYGGKELCVKAENSGWFDVDCSSTLSFVCYHAKNNTYIWITEVMNWTEAQSYCRENYTDLTSVRNETELQHILNISGGSPVWIGLYRSRLWSDQSSSTFTYWNPESLSERKEPDNGVYANEQENQHCTAVNEVGWWRDEDCLATFPFVCYSENTPGSVMGFRMKIKTWENLDDSKIEEFVSEQLKQELSRLGLPTNVSISLKNTCKANP